MTTPTVCNSFHSSTIQMKSGKMWTTVQRFATFFILVGNAVVLVVPSSVSSLFTPLQQEQQQQFNLHSSSIHSQDFLPFQAHELPSTGRSSPSHGGRMLWNESRSIVVRILPKNMKQLLTLQKVESLGNPVLDFWTSARIVNKPVDIRMVRTFYSLRFKDWLSRNGLIDEHQIMIPDVERLIEEEAEEARILEARKVSLFHSLQTFESLNASNKYFFLQEDNPDNDDDDDKKRDDHLSFFSSYHSLDEIFEFLNKIESLEEAKDVNFKTFSIGNSYEGRPLIVASLGLPSPPSKKNVSKKKGKGNKKKRKEGDKRKKNQKKTGQGKKKQKKGQQGKKNKKKQKVQSEDIETLVLKGRRGDEDDEDGKNENDKKKKKPLIWIDCQFHAREWISAPTCLYLILMLVKGSKSGETKKFLQTFDFHFLPVSNPDGFEFSRTPNHRMWRKTRSKRQNKCIGVDPNRNWSFKWGTGGSSDDPCDETYKGPHPFSEKMTQAIRDHLLEESKQREVPLYLSIHSYSQFIIIPWSYSKKLPVNYMSMYDKAIATARAIGKFSGTEYFVGQSVRTMYIASGTSDDYALAVVGAHNSYTMEVRDTGKHGFMLPANQILPNGREVWTGLQVMFRQLVKEENESSKSPDDDENKNKKKQKMKESGSRKKKEKWRGNKKKDKDFQLIQ